jgi:two-component system OmpR family response regulator
VPTAGVCEDDHTLRQILRTALERAGYTVRATASGTEAVRVFAASRPDVLVLDIGLPDADGRDVCQALRARGVHAPVLFLTARDAVTDRVSGFHAGGDDYLTKPFAMAELLVRIEALTRRGPKLGNHAPATAAVIGAALGGVLDPARHAIVASTSGAEGAVRLTPTEYRLLAAICAAGEGVVRGSSLISAAWPDGATVSENTLDAYISRIRAKLRQAGRAETVKNVRGVGYSLS